MKPAYFRISPVNINGRETNRLMLVLKTRGCEYAQKTGGCSVCGFSNHASEQIAGDDLIAQVDYCLGAIRLHDVEEIDLLTLGSFLNDREVSPQIRQSLLTKVSSLKGLRRVSIESRAEYVTAAKLQACQALLGNVTLEFGIGLESADDYIRNVIVRKGLTRQSFEQVVHQVKAAGCDLLVYLLIKPPHLSEQAAIADAVRSARYVFEIARQAAVAVRVAYEPVFICENTALEQLFLNQQYRLVNLWSVVEVIRQTHQWGNLFVGLSDENLSLDRMPGSCPKCSKRIVDEIEHFNRTQSISGLEQLECDCKNRYAEQLREGLL